MNYPTYEEPTWWPWRTNPRLGLILQFLLFYWPVNISMFTNHSIANALWRARKDLYNYAHTTTLILHLILQKLLGLENHDDPSQLSSSYCSFKLANELYIVTTSLRHVAFFLLYLTPDDTRTIFYSHIYIYTYSLLGFRCYASNGYFAHVPDRRPRGVYL